MTSSRRNALRQRLRTEPTAQQLRRHACTYAAAGWRVAPGAEWSEREQRYRCATPDCRVKGIHALTVDTRGNGEFCGASPDIAATKDFTTINTIWRRPYPVFLSTGDVCDVLALEVPLARRVVARLDSWNELGPVAASGDQILIFTTPRRRSPAIADPWARWHGHGQWVPLPPSGRGTAAVAWIRPLAATIRLALSHRVLDALDLAIDARRESEPSFVIGRTG